MLSCLQSSFFTYSSVLERFLLTVRATLLTIDQELSGDPHPQYFSRVLPYKWEACCSANGEMCRWVSLSSRLRSQESPAIQVGGGAAVQIGGVLPYFLRDQSGLGF